MRFFCSINDVTVTSISGQRPRNVVFIVDEVLVVDAACIVAMTTIISFQLKPSNPARRIIFGGDSRNQSTAALTGLGIVSVQSLSSPVFFSAYSKIGHQPKFEGKPKFFAQIVTFLLLL